MRKSRTAISLNSVEHAARRGRHDSAIERDAEIEKTVALGAW
jgi:hypothetical protein